MMRIPTRYGQKYSVFYKDIFADLIKFSFPLIVFGGTGIYSPLPHPRGQPTAKCHPRWQPVLGLAIHCRLGRLLDSNPGLLFHNVASLPMSHHCSLMKLT